MQWSVVVLKFSVLKNKCWSRRSLENNDQRRCFGVGVGLFEPSNLPKILRTKPRCFFWGTFGAALVNLIFIMALGPFEEFTLGRFTILGLPGYGKLGYKTFGPTWVLTRWWLLLLLLILMLTLSVMSMVLVFVSPSELICVILILDGSLDPDCFE